MTLSIILATRGRPQLLAHTVGVTVGNLRDPQTRLIIACDDDDQPSIEAAKTLCTLSPQLELSVAPREDTLGAKYNRVLTTAPADVYLAMVDYAPHLTPGFDRKILAAAELHTDGIGVVYGHWANMSFPQINAMTHGLVEAMGYLYPPYFPYWFVDHWLDDIARMIGRIAYADVTIDCRKKTATMELREPGFWGTFYDAARHERHAIARAIIKSESFDETPARKALLINNFPIIDEHSEMINNSCRTNSEQMEQQAGAGAADERYLRAKAKARAKLRGFVAELEADEATRRMNQQPAA